MFKQWEDCEKLWKASISELPSKDDTPRHFRAMVNCALFQRFSGSDFWIVTEDDELRSYTNLWEIQCLSPEELEASASKVIQKYNQDLKAYQSSQRTATRANPGKQKTLWTPPK